MDTIEIIGLIISLITLIGFFALFWEYWEDSKNKLKTILIAALILSFLLGLTILVGGYKETSYKVKFFTLLMLIIISVIFYFMVYLPYKEKEKEKQAENKKKERAEWSTRLLLIQNGTMKPNIFGTGLFRDYYYYQCPVCGLSQGFNGKFCSICGFDTDMIPKNKDGTYTIGLWDKIENTFKEINVRDFNFVKMDSSGKVIDDVIKYLERTKTE